MDSAPFQSGGSLLQAKLLLPLVGVLLLISGIAAVVVLQRTSLDSRKGASSGAGTVTVTVNPGTSFVTPGSTQSLQLQTNTGFERVVGYELYVDFTGTVPANLAFTPATVTDLSTVTQNIATTATGKRLTLGLLVPISSPPKAFSTSNGTVTLGTLTYTAPSTGSMKIAIVPQLSRSIRYNASTTDTTEVDVLKTPIDYTYTFGSAPTIAPTPGSGTQGSPTPRVTATPSAQKPCYNTAVTVGGQLSWPNSCRGIPTTGVCTQNITPLTSAEITAYNAWVSAGRLPIPGCTVSPTFTPTPTATPRAPSPTPTPTPRPTIPPTPAPTPVVSAATNQVTVSVPNGGVYALDQSTVPLRWNLQMKSPTLLTSPAKTTLLVHKEGQLFGDVALQITNGAFTQVGDNTYNWKVQGLAPGRYQLEVLVWQSPNNVLGTLRDFSDTAFTVTTATPTPVPTVVPTPTASPFDRVISQQQWDALPGWIKNLVKSVLGL
ncbi:MAG: hypothetical protein ABI758_06440 [Candidatus Woesebacteria bacterium]